MVMIAAKGALAREALTIRCIGRDNRANSIPRRNTFLSGPQTEGPRPFFGLRQRLVALEGSASPTTPGVREDFSFPLLTNRGLAFSGPPFPT